MPDRRPILSPGWRRRTSLPSHRRLSSVRGNLPNAFTPRSRENMIRMGLIRVVPAPTSAERSAAAIKIQRFVRATKEKVNTKLAFRKSLPYVKAVLQKKKGSGDLTTNELNRLSKIVHATLTTGFNSPENASFFLSKYPNKNDPYYKSMAPVYKAKLNALAREKAKINKGVRVLSNAYRIHQNKLRANEHRRAINNISQLITSRRRNETSGVAQALLGQQRTRETAVGRFNTVGVAPLRVPIPPKSLSNAKNIHDLERMINQLSVNNQRFINAKKFVNNTFSNLEPKPNAPTRNGMTLRQYANAKRIYESNMRTWLKTAARRWYRNRGPK